MEYYIIYKENFHILYQGTYEYCKRIFKSYENFSHYALVNKQQLKQLQWEF